jgi:hypothetical protein
MESKKGANAGCCGFYDFRYVRTHPTRRVVVRPYGTPYGPSAKSYICFELIKYMDPTELWIKEQERFLSADKNYQREPVEYINIYFCFVDLSDSIVKVDVEKYLFSSSDPDTRIIGESILLQKVEKQRQYKFQEMMLFHVGLESTDMHNYARSKTNEYNFVETFPVIRDIYVPPSIFIFQPVNYLLVLMKERPPIRSAIKVSAGSKKRVRFSEEVHNKTRRKG